MWQIYGEKETCGTKGGLVSGWKQSMKFVSNNEWQEVSRGHSTIVVANTVGRTELQEMIVTRKLQKCGELLGIELLDHIIVGGTNGKMLSFREEKMLNVIGRMDWERQKKRELEVFIY